MIISDSKIWTSELPQPFARDIPGNSDSLERQKANGSSSKRDTRKIARFGCLVGQSAEMARVYEMIESVAASTASVVVTGESGTGKELVARALHDRSNRSQGPFVAVNCSALPRDILENELFGHEQGAFTGALKEKPGCFELADHGTLFLDEICEMPLELQAKMLRVLEERNFRRLGGRQELAVDVRIVSASNRKLDRALKDGALRQDLYYRLCVVEIDLPPLRLRDGDLALLVEEFLIRYCDMNRKQIRTVSTDCIEALERYHWPGNIRELKNTIERAVVLCHGDTIQLKHIPKRIANSQESVSDIHIPVGTTLAATERQVIRKTLEYANNNKTKTAQILGISLKTLHNKLNHYKSLNLH